TGALLFFGLIDAADPFTSVTFHRDAVGYIFAFDDFVYGTTAAVPTAVAPEPVSMLLLGTGLVGVVAVSGCRRGRDSYGVRAGEGGRPPCSTVATRRRGGRGLRHVPRQLPQPGRRLRAAGRPPVAAGREGAARPHLGPVRRRGALE